MTALCEFCGTNPAVSGGLCGRCESEQQRLGRVDYPAHAQHSDNPRPDSGKRHEQRVRDTRQHLGELPELYAALDDFWEPGSTPKDPDQRSGKSNPAWRCVVNLDVLDLTDMRLKDGADATRADYWRDAAEGARRQGVVQTLASWCRLVHEERAAEWDENFPVDLVELSEEPTIVSECAYLMEYLDWTQQQPWFVELHDDVRKIWGDVRRAIGDRDEMLLECDQCGWKLEAMGEYDTERRRYPWYRCTGCPNNVVTENELNRAERAAEDFVTLEYAAKKVGRSSSTLRNWRQRGLITPEGKDRRGDIFLLSAIQKVDAGMQRRDRTPAA